MRGGIDGATGLLAVAIRHAADNLAGRGRSDNDVFVIGGIHPFATEITPLPEQQRVQQTKHWRYSDERGNRPR
jgi:hypothetical protein